MPLLGLAYNPDLPRGLLAELERAGRSLGLSLAALERLGQSLELCTAFVKAARRGDRARLRFLAEAVSEAVAVPPPVPVREAVVPPVAALRRP